MSRFGRSLFVFSALLWPHGFTLAQEVRLELWTISLAPLFSAYIEETLSRYEAEHPQVTVVWTDHSLEALGPELLAAIAAGRAPDVVNLNVPMLLDYGERGLLRDLGEGLGDERRRYLAKALSPLRISGEQLGVPWYFAPPVLLYNRQIFLQAGIDPARPPRTATELIGYAKRIKDATGRYGFMPELTNQKLLYRFLEAGLPVLKGGAEAAFDSPAHVAFLEAFVTLFSEDYLPEDALTGGHPAAVERYGAGQLAMLLTGPQFLSRIKLSHPEVYAETLVAPYPLGEGRILHAPLMGLSVLTASAHPGEALSLALFLSSDERLLAFSKETAVLPTTKEALADPFYTVPPEHPGPEDLARIIQVRKLPYAQDLTPSLPNAPTLFRWLQGEMTAVVSGREAPAKALGAAVKVAQARLRFVEDAYLPYRSDSSDTRIVPPPQEERARYEGFAFTPRTVIHLVKDTPVLRRAAQTLQDELQARFGLTLTVKAGGEVAAKSIVIGTVDDASMRGLLASRKLAAVEKPEGYVLEVDGGGVAVVGGDERGAFYGVQSLRQLLQREPAFRGATIRDWPDLRERVAMIYLDSHSDEVNIKLIPILAQHKFNGLLIMSNYVQWESAPALHAPGGATKSMAERVVKTARDYLLEPIPLLETLSHAGWLFQNGQNRDLLEDPDAPRPYVYNPLNPRVYRVLLPILDEVVDLFEPRYVHIGHDEVAGMVTFPASEEGKRLGLPQLFLMDTQKLYRHLASRGVGTMMWQDTLLTNGVAALLERFPKDIVITSWHYRPGRDYPALRRLKEAGFGVLGASWYDPANIASLAKAALRHGAAGMVQTRWTGYFGNLGMFGSQFQQVYAYLTAASAFWNTEGELPENAAARFRELWQGEPMAEARSGRLVDLSPYGNRSLAEIGEGGWLGGEADLSALLEPGLRFAGLRFSLGPVISLRGSHRPAVGEPVAAGVPLYLHASALAFLHVTGGSAPLGTEVGRYLVHYSDGTEEEVPVRYGTNIAALQDVEVRAIELEQAWRGEVRSGVEAAVTLQLWQNQRPDVEIERVEFISLVTTANPLLLGLTVLE